MIISHFPVSVQYAMRYNFFLEFGHFQASPLGIMKIGSRPLYVMQYIVHL